MTVLANSVSKDKKKGKPFLREVQSELKKVHWTSKEELSKCTKIVLGSTVCFGLGIYIADLMVQCILRGIHQMAYWVGG